MQFTWYALLASERPINAMEAECIRLYYDKITRIRITAAVLTREWMDMVHARWYHVPDEEVLLSQQNNGATGGHGGGSWPTS